MFQSVGITWPIDPVVDGTFELDTEGATQDLIQFQQQIWIEKNLASKRESKE